MWGSNLGLTTLAARPRSGFSPGQLAGLSAWYDPSDLSTLFQDTGMTVPVTVAGQSVAAMRDKSGNGWHSTQANVAKRPVLQQDGGGRSYLAFDGVDDVLAAGISGLGGNSDKTLLAGVLSNKVDNATIAQIGATTTRAAFGLGYPSVSGRVGLFQWSADLELIGGAIAGEAVVYAGIKDDNMLSLRRNGTLGAGPNDLGVANVAATTSLHIGSRSNGSAFFSGRLYGLLLIAAVPAAETLARAEAWMAAKSGVAG